MEIVELLQSSEFDLFHYSGHDTAGFGPVDDAMLLVDDTFMHEGEVVGGGLTASMVRSLRFQDGHRPLVFLNACESGRLGSGLGGFAAAFMEAGAGAFVGSQWAIDAEPAKDFAMAFYERFLTGKTPLAEAVSEARQHRGSTWTANRLAYVAYGDPEVVADPDAR